MARWTVLFALSAGLSACGGGSTLPTGPSPVSSSVELEYRIAAAAPAESAALDCAGQMRLYPSWWGFSQVTMVGTGQDQWSLLFEDVPVGEHRVKVVPPEGCGSGALAANGTPLEASDEGFVFVLHPDGSITR